ncbi:radical SAM (seleno)protein TrsS [Consotaella salsifontis]|uniref:Radical SAM core domain-containing protein n=1 Tax=Consotaella salsifontis TaxID=1365950 RepID=A0A1T4MHT4_9HYPH|nr:radical SAM (seleno)protein TrsS [Consotaella salsifontis]SJZ66650.1 hypothetical protein SAMN05428963_102131 [Consotaella salsifontis]
MDMPDSRLFLGETQSVCPECLKTIPARRFAEGDTVFLEKVCPDHGRFSAPVWRGLSSYLLWAEARRAEARPLLTATEVKDGCPHDCGLCPGHRQQSCCVLLEVTSRCDIACPVCFANAGRHGRDASLEEISGWLDTLAAAGGPVHIQLSGGEPTTRDDLADIVRLVRAKGFGFVQVNTNGLRIARDPNYLQGLVEAGLDCIFLQFDGVDDGVYRALRGVPLMKMKARAIANCREAGVGVVLVPTLVPGVNSRQIGAIVDFAIDNMPAVRAVHFQPVSYFGRVPHEPTDEMRITLPEVMEALVDYSKGSIGIPDFNPGSAENPFCSFSGRFFVAADRTLSADGEAPASCCGVPAGAGEDTAVAPAHQESKCCGGHTATEGSCCDANTHERKGECCGGEEQRKSGGETCCKESVEHENEPRHASCCGSAKASADVARAQRYVSGQWTRPSPSAGPSDGLEAFDAFLARRERRALGLSGMAFQDAWTLDIERLRQCHIHVVSPDNRVIPFCAFNLTDRNGRSLYRPSGG